MSVDVSVVGLYILDVLGRPVERIPDRGNVEFIDQIKLTVAGTAGGTVVDLAKLGIEECGHWGAAAASLVASGLGSDAGIERAAQTKAAMDRWRR